MLDSHHTKHGERVIYTGEEGPDLTPGECGVAWVLPEADDPESIYYECAAFYPDGDAIGYYVQCKDLELEI